MNMNKTNKMNAELIRNFLKKRIKPKEWLALELGVSVALINKMFYENHIPKNRTINDLAQLMNVSPESLFLNHTERGAV